MKSVIRPAAKQFVVSLAALAVLALGHSTARADEVHIAGFTNGCFGAACAPGMSATSGGLFFGNSTFLGTTTGGAHLFAAAAVPGSNVDNMGFLTLNSVPQSYDTPFTLLVTFTAPQNISGSNSSTFVAAIVGTVTTNTAGGVFVDFDNTPALFNFNDPNCEPDPTGGVPGQQTTCGSGSFVFSVNDLGIDPGMNAPITGQVTAAQQLTSVPEPATLLLLGTGLTGIAARLRRRRQTSRKAGD